MVWGERHPRTPTELFDFLSDPLRFPGIGNLRSSEYEIGNDRYFMMGDNSPRSKDSRGWGTEDSEWDTTDRKPWEVQYRFVTGMAFFVYWPHGVAGWPNFGLPNNPDIRLPFRPNVERIMKWIR